MTKKVTPEELEQISPVNLLLTLTIIGGLAAFIGWAAFSPLDIVSVADGTVNPSSRVQYVQHLEGGIIRELLVEEGETVEKGQPLANLDTVATGSDFGELTARVNSLSINLVRLDAEKFNYDAPDFAEFIRTNKELTEKETALFVARRNTLKSKVYAQEKELAQRYEDIKQYQSRLIYSKSRLKLVTEQVKIGERLIKKKLSNRFEQLERLKEQNTIQNQIDDDRIALDRSKQAAQAAQAALDGVTNKYREDVLAQLSSTRQELNEVNERLQKLSDSLERTVLRAPMSGIVKSIYVSTEGGVVSPGGVIMDLVPQNDTLVVEAMLQPQDIGHIRIGQKTFFQLASHEAMQSGRIEGIVEHISPDTMTTEGGTPYFTVRVRTSETEFRNGDNIYKLVPGVQVSVGIVTGQRSVLAYFIEPLFHTLPFSLSER